jgi:hemerythrin superfamily protein
MPTRIRESTSARAPRAETPRNDGLIGVFRTLADQHAQVAQLLAQLQADPSSRGALWPRVRRELVSHEQSEVRELYPVLRQFEELRALADEHDAEARELDALIARLDAVDSQSDIWAQALEVLTQTVLHHAKEEEEQKIFPAAQQVIGEARAFELDEKVLLTKQKVSEQN